MDQEPGMEHREEADRLEREADKLEQESTRVGDKIDDAREDWKAKEGDVAVPGAQPDLEETLGENEDEQNDDDDEES
jgi:hypothetical protein